MCVSHVSVELFYSHGPQAPSYINTELFWFERRADLVRTSEQSICTLRDVVHLLESSGIVYNNQIEDSVSCD